MELTGVPFQSCLMSLARNLRSTSSCNWLIFWGKASKEYRDHIRTLSAPGREFRPRAGRTLFKQRNLRLFIFEKQFGSQYAACDGETIH